MSCTRLADDDRYAIYEQHREGVSLTKIAKALGRSKSTISREISRNRGERGYRPRQASLKALERSKAKRGGRLVCQQSWHHICPLLQKSYSPEQACGKTKLKGYASISHETVYKRIYAEKAVGGSLWRYLRCQKKRRKRYGSGHQKRGQIRNRVDISERSPRVDARTEIDHWESDTVIGRNHKGAIVTLVERKSGYSVTAKVETKNVKVVANAIIVAMMPYKHAVKAITFDNGLEFAEHERIAAALKAKIYFARAYASWQRGTNENFNELLRQYFPKKSCFASLSKQRLRRVTRRLNNRPRKRLAWRSPAAILLPRLKHADVALVL